MRKLATLLLAAVLYIAPLTLTTGCVAPTAPRAKVYLTLKSIWILKDKAMRVYAEKAVQRKISPEQRSRVWTMHAEFQTAYDLAMAGTGFDTSQTAPDNLVNLTDSLIAFINSL